MTTSCIIITSDYVITIWSSHIHVLISDLIHSKSALNQRCSALKTQCFRATKISDEHHWFRTDSLWNSPPLSWILQFWTDMNQRKSELISSETALISSDVLHVLWISAEKCQNSETMLFSADYLWNFNPE